MMTTSGSAAPVVFKKRSPVVQATVTGTEPGLGVKDATVLCPGGDMQHKVAGNVRKCEMMGLSVWQTRHELLEDGHQSWVGLKHPDFGMTGETFGQGGDKKPGIGTNVPDHRVRGCQFFEGRNHPVLVPGFIK